MKPSIAIIVAASFLAAQAHAGKPHVAPEKKAPCKKMGDLFELAPRHKDIPVGEEPVYVARPKPLSDGQINKVVKTKLAEVQNCWNRLPSDARKTDTTALIRLAVEADGSVTDVDIGGPIPAYAQKCIAAAAAKWTFPVAEISSDVETAVALRAL